MIKLSAVINTKNASDTLNDCLKSVEFADEIIVVDMQSNDDTKKIAAQYTDNIFDHEDVGYVEPARNFAIDKAQGEWILIVDADEIIPHSLKDHILELIAQGPNNEIDCYKIPRKNIIFKRWIDSTGWWPDYQVRLFKKGTVNWSEKIHGQPEIKGNITELPAAEKFAIFHQHYTSVHQFVERLNRYTDHQADQQAENTQLTTASLANSFFSEFFSRFFHHEGNSLGAHGLSLSLLQASYELIVKMKIWEKKNFKPLAPDNQQLINSLKVISSDFQYWIADWQVKNSTGLNKIYWRVRRKLRF